MLLMIILLASIGAQLADAIPSTNESPKRFLKGTQQNCSFLYPTTSIEIQDEIRKLNPSKSCGPHGIPINLLQLQIICPNLWRYFLIILLKLEWYQVSLRLLE